MKRLVICNDGTWNTLNNKDEGKTAPTNIVKIMKTVSAVDKNNITQMVFYDQGVGSYIGEKIIGGATGYGLSKNIKESYQWLSKNYEKGDEIFIFGFSRGAYTARSLVGLINKIGMVKESDLKYLEKLFKFYRKETNDFEINDFYQRSGIELFKPKIKFIGVFDTVGALGIPINIVNYLISKLPFVNFTFHNTKLSSSVENAYHALSIDEKREAFKPTLWDKIKGSQTLMEQRWFAGVHSNVGGGYYPDDLANITLKYMTEKAKNCGLEFNQQKLDEYSFKIKTPIRTSMNPIYWMLSIINIKPNYIREIRIKKGGEQVIDSSVIDKIEKDSTYRPKNIF